MKKINKILNGITMYRLVVYGLVGYSILGIFFAFRGELSSSPTAMVVSLALLLMSAYAADRSFARLWNTPANTESWLITAMILFLIVKPASTLEAGIALVLAGAVSSVSKYIIAWNGKHIFNPAALAAALLSLTSLQATTWWIGSSLFWPFTLLVGLAIVRKVRRIPLVATFVGTTMLVQIIVFLIQGQELGTGMKGALIASPLIFLATIMITEPATMPPRRLEQIIFAIGIAVLYVMGWKIGPLNIYPEVALLIGNVYAFIVSPKFKVRMQLTEIQRISDQVYNYVFRPDRQFAFLPGQYMEWTLAGVPYDSRGNRRTFTIASSPTEKDIQLGLKYYRPASAYKSTFARLRVGDSVYASQLTGNFTLDPADHTKLAFIAGGIGITPFRSMIKYIVDQNLQRDITLLYVVSDGAELAYHQDFLEAERNGIRYVPIVTKPSSTVNGVVNAKLSRATISHFVPDYLERHFYISGPNQMVDGTKDYLKNLGVLSANIQTDHFSGY